MDVNEVDYIKIGQRIRAARLKLGWQQAEVAFRAGLTTSHMSHIETGQTKVALPTIVKMRTPPRQITSTGGIEQSFRLN